ncbi:hypothetical protein [Alteromonas gilva]|uniref:Lipoprotein n=1 Tax=Alteromonas gilva TaxID=2987522 RepID=A0ABT5L7F0_9ALTE|nr:hypothetical protein [Alteromonas gilva]MDC8832964.1 hypothetical protein [Alteromonas gilva]
MRFFTTILAASALTLSGCSWFSDDIRNGQSSELGGSWFYNEGTCSNSVVRETLYEISFGNDLPPGTLNSIHTNSPRFTTSALNEDDQVVVDAKTRLGECEGFDIPAGEVIYITYDNVRSVQKFLFYKDTGKLYSITNNQVMPLIRLTHLNILISQEDPSIKETH